MIVRFIVSEVDRAGRQRAARNRAAAARPWPPMPPAKPPRRTSPAVAVIGSLCGVTVFALGITLLVQRHDQTDTLLANQQTCSAVWEWTANYDVGLDDEIGPASLTPDPQLRGDVARLLMDVQDAPVRNAAIIPGPQIKTDLSALSARCGTLGLNPGGNDGAAIP